MRTVERSQDLAEAFRRCESEARQAFGDGRLYLERLVRRARHIEIQIVGDGSGAVTHLWERECSLQRRFQKLVEIAPSPSLTQELREKMIAEALRMAEAVDYQGVGTFEFLVDTEAGSAGQTQYGFMEVNPRLQVEHTVTEAVMGVDLVAIQLQLAAGRTLRDLGWDRQKPESPRGYAIEIRINTEVLDNDGTIRSGSGQLTAFELPSGPGVRVDTYGYVGYRPAAAFDSLLAKLIVHHPSPRFTDAVQRTLRALAEFKINGIPTNLALQESILRHPDFQAQCIHTRFVEENLKTLLAAKPSPPKTYPENAESRATTVGAKVDPNDPLAVLDYGKTAERNGGNESSPLFDTESVWESAADTLVIKAPMQGTIVTVEVEIGAVVQPEQTLLVMNAMKMEHVVNAAHQGTVSRIIVGEGDTVAVGQPLVVLVRSETTAQSGQIVEAIDPDQIRPDLAEVIQRHGFTLDENRAEAVAKRQQQGQRTARANILDLCDEGTFVEYGALAIAGQRARRSLEDLIERTPADGLITGWGRVNGHLFDDEAARCLLLSYDYTVLAGTQGMQNHRKKDRVLSLAEKWRIPLVIFTEGGGGRPGDTDFNIVAGLDCMAFHLFARLSGLVPMVGITSGRCFAGNAALLGCCDVLIATRHANIGMGGPAMIEGGGLGVFRAEEIGPLSVQVPNGVVDIVATDEAEAVKIAKRYLSYFQGKISAWDCADQRLLRRIIPENRLRIYDTRQVIETLADTGSVLELRPHFGLGMVTALARIEGRPLGIIANNPKHLSGAIDSPAADKAARFMQLCDAFDLPILFLCDTPGIMVGPEVEKTALVRHCCRMFVTGASLTVPFFTIVLRKSYGLGAQAMAGGSHKANLFTVAWPTGEFGGMGLEGAVKLGFRRELAAEQDPMARKQLFDDMVALAYQHGKALNTAANFEIDDVIDPAESRRVITRALKTLPPPPPRTGKKRPCIDSW